MDFFRRKQSKSESEIPEVFRLGEKKFRIIFEKSPVGLLFITSDGKFIDANESFLKLIGYNAIELLNHTFWDFITKEYLAQGREYVHLMIETGAYGPCETEIVHKSGRQTPVLLTGSLIKDQTDQYLLLIVHDITERKRSETILLNSIGDGVVAIDRQWNITNWNNAASTISGWQREEVLGRPFREYIKFIRERDRAENITFIEEAMLFGKVTPLRNSTNLLRKDGKEIPIGDSAAPIFDPMGKVIGAIIIFRDISQEKESQQLRSDFAYASHQLRTPVTQALWSIEVAKESKDREEIGKNLNIAEKSIRSVSKLTDQLIEASEIDQGMIMTKREMERVSSVIDELLESFKQKAQEADMVIEVGPISPTVSIETDIKMLRRILWEILDNAVNYSRRGGRIAVNHVIQNREIIFEIKDFGIGISKEEAPLIFTKFFRGRNFNTNEIAGAGLGLFIAKEYIKLLQGKIWFSSEEGTGASFYISLPLLQSSS